MVAMTTTTFLCVGQVLPTLWKQNVTTRTVKLQQNINTILNNYSIVMYIKMDYHYSSLQCHMIIQKSDLLLKKYFLLMLKTIVLIHIFVETMIRFLFRTF